MTKLVATSLACTLLTTAAVAATLNVDNQTDKYSTALVNGKCQGGFQHFTLPHQMGDAIPWLIVQLLCGHSTGNCSADVYLFNSPNCTDPASGIKLTTATLALDTGAITPSSASASGYKMDTFGKNYYIHFA